MPRTARISLPLLALLACKPAAPETTPPEPTPTLPATKSATAELSAIADAIDPGPQVALVQGIPPWVLLAVGIPERLSTEPQALQAEFDAAMIAFTDAAAVGGDNAMLQAAMALGRAAVYAELAATASSPDGDTLARLERAYDLLDAPLLSGDGMFGQFLQMFVAAAAADGHIDDARQIDEAGSAVFGVLERAGALHRRTVAQLLRTDPGHEAVPDALMNAAQAVRDSDDALAVRMGELSLSLRGSDASAAHASELSQLCFAALDLACGERASARATTLLPTADPSAASDDGSSPTSPAVMSTEALARRVVALEGKTGFEDRLLRARALLDLSRNDQAKAEFEALRREHPSDARPVAGLAKLAVQTRLDFQTANAIIDGAGTLEHGDAEYYQLAIGTRATALVSLVLPDAAQGNWAAAMLTLAPLMERMRRDIAAYEKLGETDGRYLRFVYELVVEGLPSMQSRDQAALVGLLRGLLVGTLALQAEIPDNAHAYRLMMAATQFARDRAQALTAMQRPLPSEPEHRAELAQRQLVAWRDLAVTWDDPAFAARMVTALEAAALPASMARVAGDVQAVQARLVDPALWPAALASYRQAVGDATVSTDASALNNLAMALAETGDAATAVAVWQRAAEFGESWGDLSRINIAVVQRDAPDLETLRKIAEQAERDVVRLAAWSWLAALEPDAKQRKRARRALQKEARAGASEQLRPRLTPGLAGVALEGNLEVGLGYSTLKGLEIKLDSASVAWLTFPVPVPLQD